ncbi:MAG: hypothetical protein WCV56_05565 [Candidatus Omnitrophota bacterium]
MILVVDYSMSGAKILAYEKNGNKRSVPLGEESFSGEPEVLRKAVRSFIGRARITAISFKMIFGGDLFDGPTLVDEAFFERFVGLTEQFSFYVPSAAEILKKFRLAFHDVPLIAFFETSFFRDLPDEEKFYALPLEYCAENNIRKWGFHGIYHEMNAGLVTDGCKCVSVVFDKQTTVCAIKEGRPVSISLGYTPLEGVMSMPSCGDLDPGIVFYLMNVHKHSIYWIDNMLKNESGFKGMTGYDIEFKDMFKLRGKDAKVDLAFEVYIAQIMKYIGEGISVLGGLDKIFFSGSNVSLLFPLVYDLVKRISFLGINIAELPWGLNDGLLRVSSDESKIEVNINSKDVLDIIFLLSKDFQGRF